MVMAADTLRGVQPQRRDSVLGGDTNGELKIGKWAALAQFLVTPTLSLAFSAQSKTKTINPYDERRLLQQNKKIHEANRARDDFPNFIREGDHVHSDDLYNLFM
ncbi:FKBP-type peptidyl-prolyl cis-trans isomerase 6, chloroplastic [Hordeum vulgare]|nr:FKBP-type peptidyl-prolyl cis-trans isomerase 6, chloroplastic [Hordeum vulgare]